MISVRTDSSRHLSRVPSYASRHSLGVSCEACRFSPSTSKTGDGSHSSLGRLTSPVKFRTCYIYGSGGAFKHTYVSLTGLVDWGTTNINQCIWLKDYPTTQYQPLYCWYPSIKHCIVGIPISTIVLLVSQYQPLYCWYPNINHCIVGIPVSTIVFYDT